MSSSYSGYTTHFYRRRSANGLLCFDGFEISYPWLVHKPVYIFNPSTQEILAPPADDNLVRKIPFSHICYYLGFTQSIDEYKVLAIRGFDSIIFGSTFQCNVFSVGSSKWREIDSTKPFDSNEFLYQTDSVCAHGILYWMLVSRKSMAAFDVVDKCFRGITMPDGYCVHAYENLIVVYGRLAIVYANFDVNIIKLCVLEDYQKEVWIQMDISLPIDSIGSNHFAPAGTIHTGEPLFTPVVSVPPTPMLFYDMKKKSFTRRVEVAGLPEHIFTTFFCKGSGSFVFCYEESIRSLRGEDQTKVLDEGA